VRKRCVRVEASIFHLVDSVHTVREELCFDAFKLVAGYDGLELNAELGSKRATFGKKFETYVSNLTIFIFAIYDQIVLFCHNC
jgi:hypothetical protein